MLLCHFGNAHSKDLVLDFKLRQELWKEFGLNVRKRQVQLVLVSDLTPKKLRHPFSITRAARLWQPRLLAVLRFLS